MTPDRLRLEETRGWLDRARSDLRAARLLNGGGLYSEALFHCQQAAEKALKAFLTFHQKPFRKTHDLGDLSPDCVSIDAALDSVVAAADNLTQYAWRFRYPGVPYEPERAEAMQGIQIAEKVSSEVERRLAALLGD